MKKFNTHIYGSLIYKFIRFFNVCMFDYTLLGILKKKNWVGYIKKTGFRQIFFYFIFIFFFYKNYY